MENNRELTYYSVCVGSFPFIKFLSYSRWVNKIFGSLFVSETNIVDRKLKDTVFIFLSSLSKFIGFFGSV